MKELQKLVKKEYNENNKLRIDKKKEKLIQVYQKLQKQNEKLRQEKNKLKSKPKTKSFDDYFRECIKNQTIPKDTPHYLKKALERALKEYNVGIKHEKSALDNFAEKYVIDGKPKIMPFEYFKENVSQINIF